MAQEKIKVLFDTDIGSDIDDAVCLAYLLAQPECDLLGITTVSGQPRLREDLSGLREHGFVALDKHGKRSRSALRPRAHLGGYARRVYRPNVDDERRRHQHGLDENT